MGRRNRVFFPIFWMVLTRVKTEGQAISVPPKRFFTPTLENYTEIQSRTNYSKFALNSIITALALLIAIPSAYVMAFNTGRYTKDILMWMLSTKMLLAVGVLMPIYLMAQSLGVFDTKFLLIVIYAMMNLPIVMLILFNYFRETPKEILEASRMDGASKFNKIKEIFVMLAWDGIASTA